MAPKRASTSRRVSMRPTGWSSSCGSMLRFRLFGIDFKVLLLFTVGISMAADCERTYCCLASTCERRMGVGGADAQQGGQGQYARREQRARALQRRDEQRAERRAGMGL